MWRWEKTERKKIVKKSSSHSCFPAALTASLLRQTPHIVRVMLQRAATSNSPIVFFHKSHYGTFTWRRPVFESTRSRSFNAEMKPEMFPLQRLKRDLVWKSHLSSAALHLRSRSRHVTTSVCIFYRHVCQHVGYWDRSFYKKRLFF